MKAKVAAKRIFDIVMILLLPVLMAKMLTGQELHEWLGVGMAVCFLLHLALNAPWFKTLLWGSYSPARCLMVIINLLLCADILTLVISGVMMSGFVFPWLPFDGGMILARQLHILTSYWGLILMSVHLGLNWSVILTAGKKLLHTPKENAVRTWVLRSLTVGVSVFGAYAVISQQLYQYLFMQTHFVLFDATKPAIIFCLETTAIMVLFAAVFHALQKLISKVNGSEKTQKAAKWVAFGIPLAICISVAISLL